MHSTKVAAERVEDAMRVFDAQWDLAVVARMTLGCVGDWERHVGVSLVVLADFTTSFVAICVTRAFASTKDVVAASTVLCVHVDR